MVLDLITIGRSSVDLYGAQVGGRLEDMRSFDKYIGGSPTNIATGAARLGLKSALITRVGDEHMGRFIREQLIGEGVDVRGVTTDPERLTALVLLGIRDDEQFPLIFYRENCADMALCEADIDADFIAEARCVTVTGTHLSHRVTKAAVLKALHLARKNGARTALDIDYRPNLWGLSGHGEGENRFVQSQKVTADLQITLHLFDLIVGTEEEFHIAGGSENTIEALRTVRKLTGATLICKRGPMGATAFEGSIPSNLDQGLSGPGFQIEVFNVLGAGDGFMSGLLKGWLDGGDWHTCLTFANACGALAVSRHGCAPAYPSLLELQYFLENGSKHYALRQDIALEQIHWSTNRLQQWPQLRVFAFDHREFFEELARKAGKGEDHIGKFKNLCLDAGRQISKGHEGYGVLCDNRFGKKALHEAADSNLWIGRPVEIQGAHPATTEPDFGELGEWPRDHVVKVLCICNLDDEKHILLEQEKAISRIFAAARRNRLEFLLEIISSKSGETADNNAAKIIERLYKIGIYPDWWKLEPLQTTAAWEYACTAIRKNDPHCRGIVVLGLDAPQQYLADCFEVAAKFDLVKGFAVGRTIFGDVASAWFGDDISDNEAVRQMAKNFSNLCKVWDDAQMKKGGTG